MVARDGIEPTPAFSGLQNESLTIRGRFRVRSWIKASHFAAAKCSRTFRVPEVRLLGGWISQGITPALSLSVWEPAFYRPNFARL